MLNPASFLSYAIKKETPLELMEQPCHMAPDSVTPEETCCYRNLHIWAVFPPLALRPSLCWPLPRRSGTGILQAAAELCGQ